jgi:hypothetical protein
MRVGMTVTLRLTAATLVSALFIAAQPPGTGKRMHMYDPATETKVSGTIEDVTQVTHGMMTGTHVTVKTQQGAKTVLLGPSDFIAKKGFKFAKGDSVEVTGSNVKMNGTEYFVAREVIKDGKTLTLRDKTGRPEWAGGMGRGPNTPQH